MPTSNLSKLNKAVTAFQKKDFQKARILLKKILKYSPNHFDAVHLDLLIDINRQEYANGLKKVQLLKKIAESPDQIYLCANTSGILFRETGRINQAIECFESIPNTHSLYNEVMPNLVGCYEKNERYQNAIDIYDALIRTSSNKSVWEIKRADCLLKTGQIHEAINCYCELSKQALSEDQFGHIGQVLERHYKYKELRNTCKEALKFYPDSAVINLLIARCELEEKKNSSAIGILSTLDMKSYSLVEQAKILTELGVAHDKNGEYIQALQSFESSSELQRTIYKKAHIKKRQDQKFLSDIFENLSKLNTETKNSLDNAIEPVFLIGFPRSGTTLLETILNSHSQISTLPELDFVAKLVANLKDSTKFPYTGYIDPQTRKVLSTSYYNDVQKYLGKNTGRIVIDKLPLNILFTPVIRTIFPNAKFILALRHPADCVLSCFMQFFDPSSQMAHFLSIEEASHRYKEVFSYWLKCKSKFNFDVHTIRYEDLVADLHEESRKMIEYIGLDYEPSMGKFYQKARAGTQINTPSFRQVSQPIYRSSEGRWKRYEFAIQDYFHLIEPFTKEFGYT